LQFQWLRFQLAGSSKRESAEVYSNSARGSKPRGLEERPHKTPAPAKRLHPGGEAIALATTEIEIAQNMRFNRWSLGIVWAWKKASEDASFP
jgi:hypothetical protein